MESAPNRELSTSIWQGNYWETEITEENVESCYTVSVLQNNSPYKEACVKFIFEILRPDNCVRFFVFGNETICDEGFLATVRDFILKHIEGVKFHPEFLNLSAAMVDTLLVPITTMSKVGDDDPQLDYSPSELFLSLYEWMSAKLHQRVIKFDQILERFPMELVHIDVLKQVVYHGVLKPYPMILMKFLDAVVKKYQKHIPQSITQGKVSLRVGRETLTTAYGAHNYYPGPKMEAVSESTTSKNQGDISELDASVSDAAEPSLSFEGSTGSFEIPSTQESDSPNVIITIEEIPRDISEVRLGVEAEVQTTSDSAYMHSERKEVKGTGNGWTSIAPDNEGDDSLLDVSFSDPALPVTGSTVSFGIPSTPERDDLEVTVGTYFPSDWLSEVMPKVHPYFPQIGDDLVYFRQGHKRYIQEVAGTGAYATTTDHIARLPYIQDPDLPAAVSVRLTNIAFKNFPPRVAILKLERMDWESKERTGNSYFICYHYIPNVTDFLVLRQVYDYALKRRWKNGYRFRSLRGNCWRTGKITRANVPFQLTFPNSHYLSLLVAWDDHGICQREESLSPWEVDLIRDDLHKRVKSYSELHKGIPVSREELFATMREIFPGKSEGQDEASRRISSLLDVILKRPSATRFMSPHAPEFEDRIECPMNLSIIKARLDNLFYRSNEAILTDSYQLVRNVIQCLTPDERVPWIIVFSRLISEIVSDVQMTEESLEKRYTQLWHERIVPDPGTSNASLVSEGRMNGNSTPVKNSLAVEGVNSSSQPSDENNRKDQVTQTETVGLSSVGDLNKSVVITSKSLPIRSRPYCLEDRSKKVLIKKEDLRSVKTELHECDFCDYTHWQKSRVKDHMNKHTGEKPYSCSDCHKSFPYRPSLYLHRKTCKVRKRAATELQ